MFFTVLYHWIGLRLFIRDADLQRPYYGIMPSKVPRFSRSFFHSHPTGVESDPVLKRVWQWLAERLLGISRLRQFEKSRLPDRESDCAFE